LSCGGRRENSKGIKSREKDGVGQKHRIRSKVEEKISTLRGRIFRVPRKPERRGKRTSSKRIERRFLITDERRA